MTHGEDDRALAEAFVAVITADGWDEASIKHRLRALRDEAAAAGKRVSEVIREKTVMPPSGA